MLITLMAMTLAQEAGDQIVGRMVNSPTFADLGTAVASWDGCLDSAMARYETSREPASVVATASLWSCQPEFQALFEARVAFKLASVPGSNEREVRLELIADNESLVRSREWRITKEVVEMRMARQ